ncbi:MAG: cell division protein FtsA [Patescibacteria group bacterium]
MNSNLFFVLDLGSHSVKGVLADIDLKSRVVEIIARAEAKSSGIRRGIIFDPGDAAQSISEVLRQIEEVSKKEISEANILLGGPCLETRFAKGSIVVSRPDEEIGPEDQRRILETVEALPSPQNRTVLHVIPQYYIIDDIDKIREVIGMQGSRLTLEATVIDIFSQAMIGLNKSLGIVGLKPNLLIANPLASAKALIPKRDREEGVCAIDFGAETTSLTVFEEDNLVYLAVIPLGSQNITNDIANALQIHFDSAERIKTGFGQALASKASKKEEIELSRFVEGEEAVVTKKHLAEIIEARLSEILGFVNDELKKLGKAGKLPAGAVIYGAGAEMPYLSQLVKKELKLSVRKGGLDHHRNYFPDEVPPQYLNAYSLILWQLESFFGSHQSSYFGRGLFGFFKKLWESFIP